MEQGTEFQLDPTFSASELEDLEQVNCVSQSLSLSILTKAVSVSHSGLLGGLHVAVDSDFFRVIIALLHQYTSTNFVPGPILPLCSLQDPLATPPGLLDSMASWC